MFIIYVTFRAIGCVSWTIVLQNSLLYSIQHTSFMYGLTPWSDGIFLEELLICFNLSLTFVMIISDFGGQIHIFLSKYAYFAENVTFDPPGCLCMDLPLGVIVFFRRTLTMLQF